MSRLKTNIKNLFLAVFGLILMACQNQNNKHSQTDSNTTKIAVAIEEKGISFKDSLPYQMVHFYKATEKSRIPADSSKYAYVKADYPTFASDQEFLNNKILNIVTAEPWTGNKHYSVEKAAQSFFKEYLEFKKDYPDSPAGYTWDDQLNVSFQDTNLVALTHVSYIYTGGAHGLQSIIYYNLDLKNNKQLELKDLLSANYSNKLTDIAESIFRKDEGLSENEGLDNYFFENNVFVINDNFIITPKGLLFTYNPYEIKAYAEGTTDLLIPYSRLTEFIKPDSFIAKYIKN